jgi:hypothetical protein
MDALERLKSKLKVNKETGCWEFTGYVMPDGYARMMVNGKRWLVHRLSWTLHNEVIHDDMYVCHHCDNPKCANPEHLFVGTPRDNAMDMVNKGRHGRYFATKTHCPQGHEYNEINTLNAPGQGRKCRECARLRAAEHRAKKVCPK